MLLVYQTGSVKVGEVVRYTVTYYPSQDRILPSPEKLYVRIRNTCAIALRAAFVHGPYTLSVAAYPSSFNPNERFANPRRYGVPEFEPMLKAGGSWEGELTVPDDVRQSAGTGAHGGFGKGPDHNAECASWIIEVSSQILFSTSAAVAYEVIVARDKKSLDLGGSLPVVSGQSKVPQPGRLEDHQQGTATQHQEDQFSSHSKGVFSRAVQLKVEDTEALWNTPRAPVWKDKKKKAKEEEAAAGEPAGGSEDQTAESKSTESKSQEGSAPRVRQKKVHLVILTHGLHSNLGADMLFLKESIDAAVKQAKIDAKKRRAKERAAERQASEAKSESSVSRPGSANGDGTPEKADQVNADDSDDEDEDEEVIVRGYSGNATKTERGIKYLGKKLARYVLSNTYPDQPYLPMGKGVPAPYTTQDPKDPKDPKDAKAEGEVPEDKKQHGTGHAGWHGHHPQLRPRSFKITSISFIAHSLGGLVQTYAVAYIQKHSPEFFNLIKPINFIALATPFLGLSNENPMYVKFALDFGLVGRTGKDLGLAWRAPTLARSGWGAIVGNLGETAHKKVYGESQPESKPLLRILPTGPAHTALKKFRNRTVYSNVVNDGIVPLRTSCLLFLDWYGLGRVEKARRDAGLVETVVGFGWAELTGTSMANSRQRQLLYDEPASVADGTETPKEAGEDMRQVPQPSEDAVQEDERASISSVRTPYSEIVKSENGEGVGGPFSSFFNLFKNNDPPKAEPISEKQKRIYSMSQTLQITDDSSSAVASSDTEAPPPRPMMVTSGNELEEDEGGMNAPPRTTVFESAGDLLNPKIPDMDYILDPSKRPRTIFHDRVYHPTDIPAPPIKGGTTPSVRRRLSRVSTWGSSQKPPTTSSQSSSSSKQESLQQPSEDSENSADTAKRRDSESSTMRVEEKIARAYHYDLSWRKVLVKLEPDAHNNIFVRRMFANAHGWPVVKHIVDAHFSDSALARMRTEDDFLGELSKDVNQPPDEHGGETISTPRLTANLDSPQAAGTETDAQEALDKVSNLPESYQEQPRRFQFSRADSVTWSDRDWVDSENESDLDSTAESKAKAKAKKKEEQQQREGGGSAADWNWKEKIVGKGKKKKSVSLSSEGSKASTIDKR